MTSLFGHLLIFSQNMALTSASNAAPPWGSYNNVNELPKHIEWGGSGISSHMKYGASIGLHCTCLWNCFQTMTERRPLHQCLQGSFKTFRTFSGSVLQMNGNLTNSSENLDFATLSTDNLRPPRSALSPPLKKEVEQVRYESISTWKPQMRGWERCKTYMMLSVSLSLAWNRYYYTLNDRQ